MRDIVHMVSFYNIYTDSLPPRARSAPSRPSSSSGGPPAAARCRPCGGGTNPTTEHRDAVGRSEARLSVYIAHPGLSPGPINTRLRRRAQELCCSNLFTLSYSTGRALHICTRVHTCVSSCKATSQDTSAVVAVCTLGALGVQSLTAHPGPGS